ncbi:MAG: hypothetical protein R3F59_28585 [Myxococcota bacterium]|nr:DUF883 family protein [Bauldia sp.]
MATPTEKELSDNLEKIRADLASLTASVKALAAESAGIQSALKEKVTATARQAMNKGEQVLHQAEEMGSEALQAAHRQASQAVDTVEGQIRQNPFAAVLIAAGIGFAFGLINRK